MDYIIMFLGGILLALLIYKLWQLSRQNKDLMNAQESFHREIQEKLFAHSDQFERKFQSTTTNLFTISKSLTDMQTSQRHIKELRDELTSLNAILHTPKLRGNLGELMLEDLLKNYFPTSRYALQHSFRNGSTVDACIFLEDSFKLCIDAKFPLENYRKFVQDNSKDKYLKEFVRDVKKHINDISNKYILQEEKTLSFALMYVPSETIYYEMISRKELGDIMPYAHKKNVIPVSPSTLFSYIQILLLGFKGLQIEEHAEKILLTVEQLHTSLKKFSTQYEKIGKHIHNANAAFDDSRRLLHKVEIVSDNLKELEEGKDIPAPSLDEEEMIASSPTLKDMNDQDEDPTPEQRTDTTEEDDSSFTIRHIPIEK